MLSKQYYVAVAIYRATVLLYCCHIQGTLSIDHTQNLGRGHVYYPPDYHRRGTSRYNFEREANFVKQTRRECRVYSALTGL